MIVRHVSRVLAILGIVAGCSGVVVADGGVGASRAPRPATPAPGTPERPVPEPVAIQVGPGDRKQIALTFDADMTPEMRERLDSGVVRTWYNEEVIDVLRNTGTPATLFLTGLWAQTYPGVTRSLAGDPRFEIANHSLEHKAFRPCYTLPVLREDEKQEAITGSERVVEQISGERPYYFRFPGGSAECATPDDIALVTAAGEQAVDWTAAGDAAQPDPQAVVDSVMKDIRPGAIVALHMHGSDETANAPATDEAIAMLIPQLKAQGYEFVTLGQLLQR
jgi:peptidoglycan-N-acetylglucosamine deacetylase